MITEKVRLFFNYHHIESDQDHVFYSEEVGDVGDLVSTIRPVMDFILIVAPSRSSTAGDPVEVWVDFFRCLLRAPIPIPRAAPLNNFFIMQIPPPSITSIEQIKIRTDPITIRNPNITPAIKTVNTINHFLVEAGARCHDECLLAFKYSGDRFGGEIFSRDGTWLRLTNYFASPQFVPHPESTNRGRRSGTHVSIIIFA